MRQSKASRQNRRFLTVTMLVGFILLVSIGALWTVAFENEKTKNAFKERDKYTMSLDQSLIGDSLQVNVNDSTIYMGKVTKESMGKMRAKGNNVQNMLSIKNLATQKTINENLPIDSASIIIGKDYTGNYVISVTKL